MSNLIRVHIDVAKNLNNLKELLEAASEIASNENGATHALMLEAVSIEMFASDQQPAKITDPQVVEGQATGSMTPAGTAAFTRTPSLEGTRVSDASYSSPVVVEDVWFAVTSSGDKIHIQKNMSIVWCGRGLEDGLIKVSRQDLLDHLCKNCRRNWSLHDAVGKDMAAKSNKQFVDSLYDAQA